MLASCDHCGHRNEVPDSAENTKVLCQKCGQPFFALTAEEIAADHRGTKLVLGAVLLVLTVLFLLLLSRSSSHVVKTAQRALVGGAIAGKLGDGDGGEGGGGRGDGTEAAAGNGEGNRSAGGGRNGSGRAGGGFNGPADPLATNVERSPDASIGRLPQSIGTRKAGDEVRAGAAGTDEKAERVGNSRTGQITNAPSAGGNPGNWDRRNSVETPEGTDLLTGNSAGGDAGSLSLINGRNNALLLDDFSERLRQAGARSGDVQISLEWKNVNDLDLHVIDSSGERIFYNHRNSQSGGHLDVDMNANQLTARPVENVYWPEQGAPRGTYKVEVVHFANHGARDPTEFNVRVVNKGQTSYYRGYIRYVEGPARAHVQVCTFVVQ
ncbi:MAG TPA: hypothetical protein VI282_00835 [Verrucomicrobiae bacterium]